MNIRLGFEKDTAQPVDIRLHHLAACGMTQLAGKTTAIEALVHRSGKPAVAFITKPGETAFKDTGVEIPPFYTERADWQYVAELMESMMREKMKFERSWIIKACKGTQALRDIYTNIKGYLDSSKLRGIDESVYTNLAAYLEIVIPQLEQSKLSTELELHKALNVMRLENYGRELQQLVMAATVDHIRKHYRDIILVVPEAWETLPYEGSPVRLPAETYIRKGAAVGQYLWLDSQDIAGVNRVFFRQIDNWLLGRQRDPLEVQRNLDAIPLPGNQKPKPDEIQRLTLGFFYVCSQNWVKQVYVQPAWLPEDVAVKIAKGELSVEQASEYKVLIQMPDHPETLQPTTPIISVPHYGHQLSAPTVSPSTERLQKAELRIRELEAEADTLEASQKTSIEQIQRLEHERDAEKNRADTLLVQVTAYEAFGTLLRQLVGIDPEEIEQHIYERLMQQLPTALPTASHTATLAEDRTVRANIEPWLKSPHTPEASKKILQVFQNMPPGVTLAYGELVVRAGYSVKSSAPRMGLQFLKRNKLVAETSSGLKLAGE